MRRGSCHLCFLNRVIASRRNSTNGITLEETKENWDTAGKELIRDDEEEWLKQKEEKMWLTDKEETQTKKNEEEAMA